MTEVWLAVAALLLQIWHSASQEGVRDDSRVDSVVRQAVADEFSSEILTNRTRAFLSCASGEMVVKLNYSEPFRGITYTDYDRTSPCKFYGDGRKYYELRIPLKGCGTREEDHRVFVNNIIVRFHRSLQLEEDEIKTIICRYPPPLAPVPPLVVAPILATEPPVAAVLPPKLSEVELLLIICALLFLTLLLLGIGVAYYCLKKRNIKVMKRKKALSSAPPSAITKLSGSTMGSLMFDQIRIPRAIAQSTSGSEAALLAAADRSDTIPSDYPSESPSSLSDTEEVEGHRSVLVSETSATKHDRFRYENTAFVPDEGSVYSGYPPDQERADSVSSVPVTMMAKPPDKKRMKLAMEQILTTISEREDILQQEQVDRRRATVSDVVSEMLPPPRARTTKLPSLYGSIPDNDNWSQSEMESRPPVQPFVRKPKTETATLTDYLIDTQEARDTQEDTTRHRQTTYQQLEKAVVPRKPKITIQNIDDVYVTTMTETTATEHITKRVNETIEPTPEPPPQPPTASATWDVTIRHYPSSPEDDQPDYPTIPPPTEPSVHTTDSYSRTEPPQPPSSSWDVLIRVLQPPPMEGVDDLTETDRETWRAVITTDSTFRSLIQEATTTEEYIRISKDVRYERLFTPETWKTIIKILITPPLNPPAEYQPQPPLHPPRYRKKSDGISRRPAPIARSVADIDMRSVTETEVDVARADKESLWSVDTGYTYRTSRSIAERSTSEFVEDVPTLSQRPSLRPPSSEFMTTEYGVAGQYSTNITKERSNATSTEAQYDVEAGDWDDDTPRRFQSYSPAFNHYSSELNAISDTTSSKQFSSSMARTERSFLSSDEAHHTRIMESTHDLPRSYRAHPPTLERSSSEFVTIPETTLSGRYVSSNNVAEVQRSSVASAELQHSTRRGNHAVLERSSTEIIINSPILEAVNGKSDVDWQR